MHRFISEYTENGESQKLNGNWPICITQNDRSFKPYSPAYREDVLKLAFFRWKQKHKEYPVYYFNLGLKIKIYYKHPLCRLHHERMFVRSEQCIFSRVTSLKLTLLILAIMQ